MPNIAHVNAVEAKYQKLFCVIIHRKFQNAEHARVLAAVYVAITETLMRLRLCVGFYQVLLAWVGGAPISCLYSAFISVSEYL